MRGMICSPGGITMAGSREPLLTIAAAARVVDRSPETLRLWERQGRIAPLRDSSGRRLYRASEVRAVASSIRRPGDALRAATAIRALG
jgi:predicted site-specific integrase-resolvase